MRVQLKMLLVALVAITLTAWSFAALPGKVNLSANMATADKFPDADTVLLFDEENCRYDEKGLSETTDRYFVKVLTEKGRRDQRLISIPFNRHYQTIKLEKLSIFRDGREIELSPEKLVSEESDHRSLSHNICDVDDRVLRIELPEVRIGDVIYFEFREKEIAKRMPGVWQHIALLQMTEPCLEYRYTVDAPETLPLAAIKLRNEVPGTLSTATERRDGRILYRFTAKNVPQVFFERAMFGAKWHALQRYHLSTLKSWEELSIWYANLAEPHLERRSPELIAKVAELTAKCPDDAAKVAALFRYVSQQIRYMGQIAETEAPGYEPHDVTYTFAQRAGVCRDKAALLAAMLRIARLKSYMVLIDAGEHLDPDVPLLQFNHAITAWEKAPGVFELLDPTAENTKEMLPVSDADSSYLIATEKGEPLRTTAAPAPVRNAISIESNAAIDSEGDLSGRVVVRPTGIFETTYRSKMQNLVTPERLQFIQSLVDHLGCGIEVTDLKVTPLDTCDMHQKFEMEFYFKGANALPESSCAEVLNIPRFADALGFRADLVGPVDLEKRRYPMELLSALVEEKVSVEIPRFLKIFTLPAGESFQSRIADWKTSWCEKENRLSYTSRLALKTLCVEPQEYDQLKTLSAKLKHDRTALPVGHLVFKGIPLPELLAAYPGVDDLVLSDEISVDFPSATSMRETRTVRRSILTPGGVRSHSEIILNYRPERETVEVSATILLPDGKKEVLSPENIHEIDDPAFAGAPRYAKGKKRIVNLPGVRPGAVIETTITRQVEKLPFLSGRYVLGGYSPMIHGRFSLSCDAEMELKLSDPTRNLDFSDRKKDGIRQVIGTVKNHTKVIAQKNQPPLFFFDDAIQFSTGDMEKYVREVISSMQKEIAKAGPRVEAIEKELKLQEAVTDEEKLIRIRNWVDQHIRLAGPSLDQLLPGEFASPETTIADGYGNSSDRAIVIAALCRRAGMEYEFLLASDFPGDIHTFRFLSRTPGRDFKRVLVRRKGSGYLLNDTSMDAQLGATQSEGDLGVGADGKFMIIRPKIRCESGIHRKILIEIKESGAARIRLETLYYGNEFEVQKSRLEKMTPELKRRYFRALMLAFSSSVKAIGDPEVSFSTHPGCIVMTFEVPDFAVNDGRFLVFDIPFFDEIVRQLNVGKDRQTPFVSRQQELRLDYDIVVPHGFVPTTKADGRREFGTGGAISYVGRSSFSGNKILISHNLSMPRAILSTAQAIVVELIHKKLNCPHEWRIVLENKMEGSPREK